MQILDLLFENLQLAQKEFEQSADPSEVKHALDSFRLIQQRLSGSEKDINHWRKRGFDEFQLFITQKSAEQTRGQRRKAIKAASDQILTIKKTDNVHLFMPLSEEASCFYGVKDKWCISTRDGKNFFYAYGRHSYVIFLIYNDEIYCMIITKKDGSVMECQDKWNDNDVPHSKFFKMAGMSKNQIIGFIEQNKEGISEIDKNADRKVLKSAESAYDYALEYLGGPFPEGEKIIATSAIYSYHYAKDVLEGPFPLGEKAIATSAKYSYQYAAFVLRKRFHAGEKAIATNAEYLHKYTERYLTGSSYAT